MLISTYVVIGLALFFLGLQLYWAWRFVQCYPVAVDQNVALTDRAAVILPVRGADPSLLDCVKKLLVQNYENYEIFIVIDSEHDPAWELLGNLLKDHPQSHRVHLQLLQIKHPTCSLKVSATTQVVEKFDAHFDALVLIDGDVIPYADWLRDLLLPLRDATIGATTGIRWYLPESSEWGSLVRCLWNSAACTQMVAFHIPWGGSLAVRAQAIRDSDLIQRWKQCFCEDTICYDVMRQLGLRVAFVHAATMVNPEPISLGNCFRFIRRQLLTVRLHHSGWNLLRAYGLGSSLIVLALLAFGVASAILADGLAFGLVAGIVSLYALGLALAMHRINASLRRMAEARGETIPSPPTWKLALAGPLAQGFYLAALVSVSFLRKIDWRGITYELDGPTPVRLTEYQPYVSKLDPSSSIV